MILLIYFLLIHLVIITGLKNEELADATRKSNKKEWTYKDRWTPKEEATDVPPMPPLEGDEDEVKEEKGLKVLTLNKWLTRFSILLEKIKPGNNSKIIKNNVRQTLYLLYQHNNIIKNNISFVLA